MRKSNSTLSKIKRLAHAGNMSKDNLSENGASSSTDLQFISWVFNYSQFNGIDSQYIIY